MGYFSDPFMRMFSPSCISSDNSEVISNRMSLGVMRFKFSAVAKSAIPCQLQKIRRGLQEKA